MDVFLVSNVAFFFTLYKARKVVHAIGEFRWLNAHAYYFL
jgi:hypothetical protein